MYMHITRGRISSLKAGATASAFVLLLSAGLLLAGASPACAASQSPAKDAITMTVTNVTGTLALDRQITITVANLREFLTKPGNDPKKFVLYLQGRAIEGIVPQTVPGEERLRFDVQRTEASKDAWSALLGSPHGATRQVTVSVGYDSEEPVETLVTKYELHIVRSALWAWLLGAAFFVVLAAYIWFLMDRRVLRDPSELPREYWSWSLGRTQMAVWGFLVLACFIFISQLTGAIAPLSESAIVLIGISAATALGAKTVEASNERSKSKSDEIKLLRQVFKPAEYTGTKEEIKLAKKAGYRPTDGFLCDLLADQDGYSLHRLQMAAWTVVLAIIFGSEVYRTLSMPEFDTTLLALMGISGGTYVGFKLQENKD